MNTTSDGSRQYLRSAVMTASPEQLQLMLLDGAIRFATRGLEAVRERDAEAAFNALERAQRIVVELSNGLRRDVNPVLVDQMTALFAFVLRRLIDGNLHRDPQPIDEALRILRHQRDTWAIIVEKTRRQAVPATSRPASAAQGQAAAAECAVGFVAEA